MKFIRERLNRDYLHRRILEEDARCDRKITEVILTPSEWQEFCEAEDGRLMLGMKEYQFCIAEPVSAGSHLCGPRRVTIKRGTFT